MTPFRHLCRAAGLLGVTLGAMSLLAVICFLFPAQLTSPELRAVYPMPAMRALLQAVIVASFALGALDLFGRARIRCAGTYAIALSTLAVLLGGSEVPVSGPVAKSDYLGLDWFLLDLLVVGLVFIPLERALSHRREQGIFRPRWRTDLVYFLRRCSCNVGARLGAIEGILVTPRYHHWHHSSEKAAIDTNFAVHLPIFDRLFGTQHLPPGGVWPAGHGLDGERLADGYARQFLHGFRRSSDRQ